MSHVVLDSIQEDMFICGCCKVIFKSLSVFLEHKKSPCQREDIVYNASYLNYENSPNVPQDANETSENHGETKCSVCMKKFTDDRSLLAHLRFHERSCQCPLCGRCFDNNSHVRRHIASHKVWPDGLNGTTPKSMDVDLLSYSCVYCPTVLANYSQYRAHLNTHIALKKFKCIQGDCIFFSENIEDLLHHVSDVHLYTNYICHACKLNFSSLEDIALHQQSHSHGQGGGDKATDTPHKCPQCDAVFKTPEKLSVHLLTENHNKACIHCSKAFASDKRLRMHLQIHKKYKAYQCNACGSSFNLKKYLTAHMLKHGERQFPCMICKRTFKRQDILRRHTKLHSARKLHQCPFKEAYNCPREFTRRDKMKEHMKCHMKTKNKPSKKVEPTEKSSDTVEIYIVPLDRENLGMG